MSELDAKQVKSLEIRDVFAIVRKRKWLIVIPVILVTAMAYAGTSFLDPKFESTAIVWIDKPTNVSRELASIFGDDRRESREEMRSRTVALQTELTSQRYLGQLIRDLKLDEDPDIARQAVRQLDDYPGASLDLVKRNILVTKLREQISVQFHGYDQISIRVWSNSATRARDITARLTEILEVEKTKDEMQRILDDQNFTDEQLRKSEYYYSVYTDSLNAVQSQLAKLQMPENITSEANRLQILSTVDKTDIERADYEKELLALERQLADLDINQVRFKYTDSIVELRTAIDGLVFSYANMTEKYPWNDQNVININIRLSENVRYLEQAVNAAVRDQFVSYPESHLKLLSRYFIVKENIDILNSKQRRLSESLDGISRHIDQIPRLQSRIAELTTRVDEHRQLRDALRTEERTATLLTDRAKDRTKYRVVEQAQLALAPFYPNKMKLVLIGLALGLVLGGGFVVLAEILDNSFKRVEEVEDLTGLPVLATVPRIEKLNLRR